jgi:hypothetical protein
LWREIDALSSPGAAPGIAVHPEPTATQQAIEIGRTARRGKMAAVIVSALLIALAFVGGFSAPAPLFLIVAAIAAFFLIRNGTDRSSATQGYSARFSAASSNWSKTQQEWEMRTRPSPFEEKKSELARIRDQLSGLPEVLNQRMLQLKNDQQRIQLEKYLDRFHIERANIEGIGKARTQTLAFNGIETAADLNHSALVGISGFGPKRIGALMSWRDDLASRFRFDPARGVDPSDVAKINNEVALLRRDLEQKLVGGLSHLKQIRSQILDARTRFIEPVRSVYREYLQAKADLAAAGGA